MRFLNLFRRIFGALGHPRPSEPPEPDDDRWRTIRNHQRQGDWDIAEALMPRSKDDCPEREWARARQRSRGDDIMQRHGWRKVDL
jgi:hypothetical protein